MARARARAHGESWVHRRVEITLNPYWSVWLHILSYSTSPHGLGISADKMTQCFYCLLIHKGRRLKATAPKENRRWCVIVYHWMRELHLIFCKNHKSPHRKSLHLNIWCSALPLRKLRGRLEKPHINKSLGKLLVKPSVWGFQCHLLHCHITISTTNL